MLRRFLKDETGLELTEYAVAAALIALGVVIIFRSLGATAISKIEELTAKVASS